MKTEAFSISRYLPVLLLLTFLSFFAHLGNLPLFDADEGAYSEVTREMVANNDFTAALLNGQPFFHKPPLFFWAQAASIKFLGLSEFALRLPSALAGFLWAVSIFLFTRRYYDTRSAWHATLFLTSSLLVTIIGRAATPEAIFCLFTTLTLINIYRFYHTGSRKHIYWSYMFLGLGILVKGTAALLIPAAAGFAFFALKRKLPDLLRLLLNPVGLLVFGLIVTPWCLAEFILHGKAFLHDLFFLQQPGAYPPGFIGGSLPALAYPIVLLVGLMPYTGLFVKAISRLKRLMSDDLMLFMIVWFAAALLMLPLFRPHSPFSLVYSLPPVVVIMSRISDSRSSSFNIFISPLLLTALLCLAPDLAPYLIKTFSSNSAAATAAESLVYFDASYRIILGAILILLTALPFMKTAPSHTKFAILGLLFVSMVHFLVMPVIGNTVQQPIKSAALIAKKKKLDVVTWQTQPPSFNLYAGMLTDRRRPEAGDVVLMRKATLKNVAKYETLFEKHGIILARIALME